MYKKQNAVARGLEFNLSLAEMKRILKRKTCYYTGKKIEHNQNSRNRLTLDRIDHKKGYTVENTVACCFFINQIKNELFERPNGLLAVEMKDIKKLLSKLN